MLQILVVAPAPLRPFPFCAFVHPFLIQPLAFILHPFFRFPFPAPPAILPPSSLEEQGKRVQSEPGISVVVTEADTCRKYVVPKLLAAGWDDEPHSIAVHGACTKVAERGIDGDQLAPQAGHLEADPLDPLCQLAFNAPLGTRRERADRLKREAKELFDKFGPQARAVLNDLLDKCTEHGATQFHSRMR